MKQFSLNQCICLLFIFPTTSLFIQEAQAWLIHTNRKTIERLEIGSWSNSTIVSGLRGAIAVDYHFSQDYLFWSDQTADRITRVSLSNTAKKEDLIKYTPGRADGIAVDWVFDHIYWVDAERQHVKVSKLDGTLRKTLVDTGLAYPRAIVVHPIEGFLFFTDLIDPKIVRCALDGSNYQIIVSNNTSELYVPNGLSIDFSTNRLYWVDNILKQIRHSDFQGADIQILTISSSYMPYAWGLALFGNWLYWTSFDNNTIYRVDKQTATNYQVVRTGLDQPVGIKIYSRENQPQKVNLCGQHNGGCEQLCFYNYDEGISCACADGYQLQSDRKNCLKTDIGNWLTFANAATIERLNVATTVTETIASNTSYPEDLDIHYRKGFVYWVDTTEKKIMRTPVTKDSFIGVSEVVVTENKGVPKGIAIDWIYDLLYWTDSDQGYIQVAHLDGTSRKTIAENITEPRAIVVDPTTGWVFFSTLGTKPTIQRCNMDGGERIIIIQDDISWPNGMSLDVADGRLYWIDANLNQIKSTKLDGTGTYTVIKDANVLPKPYDLVVFDKYVYWSNWLYRSILRTDKYTGKDVDAVARYVYSPMGIQMFGQGAQVNAVNLCGSNNGGCSHICYPLPATGSLKSTKIACMCPQSFRLGADSKHCVPEESLSDDISTDKGSSRQNIIWYSLIAGGCVIFIIVVVVVIFICLKRFQKREERRGSSNNQDGEQNIPISSIYETVIEDQMFGQSSEVQRPPGSREIITSRPYMPLNNVQRGDKSNEVQRPPGSDENSTSGPYMALNNLQRDNATVTVYDGLNQRQSDTQQSHALGKIRSSFDNPGYVKECQPVENE